MIIFKIPFNISTGSKPATTVGILYFSTKGLYWLVPEIRRTCPGKRKASILTP